MFQGPYTVSERCLSETYRLESPDGSRLQALVHRDRLVSVRLEGQPILWYKPTEAHAAELYGEEEEEDDRDDDLIDPDDQQL